MHTALNQLLPLFERERAAGRSLTLATLVATAGSTYRKAGAHMLIAQSGEFAGLLSGGCLEGDLREHARDVVETGESRIVSYDMRTPDDLIFGLGAGCEGAMDILLQRVSPANHWQPLTQLAANWRAHRAESIAIVVRSGEAPLPPGSVVLDNATAYSPQGPVVSPSLESKLQEIAQQAAERRTAKHALFKTHAAPGIDVLFTNPQRPPRLLVLGAGLDAQPVVELAHFLGWKVTVFDHRPSYAQRERFPHAEHVINDRPAALNERLQLEEYQACVIMSHHLASDLEYLHGVASSRIAYLGLLGPPARRERLLGDLGEAGLVLRQRLHAPVGLDIGADSPEAIALSIVTEIHAHLSGRVVTRAI